MTDYMNIALEQARKALKHGEVPIGAVIINNRGKVISKGFNNREQSRNALHHAEIIAINKACKKLKSWRLDDCVMYVTMQPCVMCAGAILNARIGKVVIGALSDRTNDLNIYTENNLNHKTEIEISTQYPECGQIVKDFFKRARACE